MSCSSLLSRQLANPSNQSPPGWIFLNFGWLFNQDSAIIDLKSLSFKDGGRSDSVMSEGCGSNSFLKFFERFAVTCCFFLGGPCVARVAWLACFAWKGMNVSQRTKATYYNPEVSHRKCPMFIYSLTSTLLHDRPTDLFVAAPNPAFVHLSAVSLALSVLDPHVLGSLAKSVLSVAIALSSGIPFAAQ